MDILNAFTLKSAALKTNGTAIWTASVSIEKQ